jgi:2-polyprenyl-3-methyl-5-hydroxy-6-metoxy-1,4-benzoquinol methylase
MGDFMEQRFVHRLEKELEQAIEDLFAARNKSRQFPHRPSPHTLQMMAKAAVAVYETAAETASSKPPRGAPPRGDAKRERFETAYEGTPPWDLQHPQPALAAIADRIKGSVLDVGCGTGENALFFAEKGHEVVGVDFVEHAVEQARRKAKKRHLRAEFLQMDALNLKELGRGFDSVIDCGLFHVLCDEDRAAYVEALAGVTRPGSHMFLMCFRDEEPGNRGPRRISQGELRAAFQRGWKVEAIEPIHFEPNPESEDREFSEGGPKGWLATIQRV